VAKPLLRRQIRDTSRPVQISPQLSKRMNKVRILFLPAVDVGNTNAQSLNVREIALRLDPDRFETALWYDYEPDHRLQKRPGIRLLKLPARGKTWRILREMLSGYDIISYIDYSPASYLFLHWPRKMRARTKAVLHAEAPLAQLMKPSSTLRFLFEGIYPRCDVYTGISGFVARDVERNLHRQVTHILPVGVDTRAFTPPALRKNPAPVILFVGTLIERKGPSYVIEAAKQFPKARFRLVGAGREGFDKSLQANITQANLNNVTLEGSKTQAEMIEIMRASDVFLLPSRLEGIPKVTLEAAATGLPCIVFRDYETPSVLDQVSGFQVETVEEMMGALGNLIRDESLRDRMGRAARSHAEKFDWDLIGKEWQNAYLAIAWARRN
jgi:glycosyltransferase involved in cell wall biosynthesis